MATLGILAGCGSPLFGVELDGGKLWRRKFPGALKVFGVNVPGNVPGDVRQSTLQLGTLSSGVTIRHLKTICGRPSQAAFIARFRNCC